MSEAGSSRSRGRRVLVGTCAIAGILASMGLVFCSVLVFPRWIAAEDLGARAVSLGPDQLATVRNDVRGTLLQAIGGIVLVVGAAATLRQLRLSRMQLILAQEQANESRRASDKQLKVTREQMMQAQEAAWQELHLTREAQVTERFTRAIDQLGSASLDVRLGGIYGLERIARDSPDEQKFVSDILAAYIRQHSPWPPSRDQCPEGTPIKVVPDLRIRAADVQAALSVLGRGIVSDKATDLSDVDLRKADLSHGHFEAALFTSSHLESSVLTEAHLEQASFLFADLSEAIMSRAYLQGATFSSMALREALFSGTNLEHAELYRVDLSGANLSEAEHLDRTVMKEVTVDSLTAWPGGMTPHPDDIIFK